MDYIVLLRGINVGGKNKVSMKELKKRLEENGLEKVTTYINSGNILFSSDHSDALYWQTCLQALLMEQFQLDLPLLVLPMQDIAEAMRHAPEWWDKEKESKHNAIFVIPPTTVEEVFREVGESKPEYEKVDFYGQVIFWSAPLQTFSRTRWSKVVGSAIYPRITIRNANTVKKLLQLGQA